MKTGHPRKYPLLFANEISRPMRWRLGWLCLTTAGLGIYDYWTGVFGERWFGIWVVFVVTAILWFYYRFLFRRVSIQLHVDHLRLQGPLYGVKISYGRVQSLSSTSLAYHYKRKELKPSEEKAVHPFWHQACLLVELNGYPPRLQKRRHWWFPPYLFGTSRTGLLLLVDDWMVLSQAIESARLAWFEQRVAPQRKQKGRTLASQIIDQYIP